jgi:predicted house-cleaning noncanonical NTP pyrophosphatase (MazG superfamily)
MRKLIRDTIEARPGDEIIRVTNPNELNDLYVEKVMEELQEIIDADFKDPMEFADLMQVVLDFARVNGFSDEELLIAVKGKEADRGRFKNRVLILKEKDE